MNVLNHFKEKYTGARQRKLLFQLALWGSLTAYMTYHLFQGNRGLVALWNLKKIVYEEQGILERLQSETASLAKQVKRLRPQSLDLAFLEERAREVLGLAAPEEVIVDVSEAVNLGQKSCIVSSQPHVRTVSSVKDVPYAQPSRTEAAPSSKPQKASKTKSARCKKVMKKGRKGR